MPFLPLTGYINTWDARVERSKPRPNSLPSDWSTGGLLLSWRAKIMCRFSCLPFNVQCRYQISLRCIREVWKINQVCQQVSLCFLERDKNTAWPWSQSWGPRSEWPNQSTNTQNSAVRKPFRGYLKAYGSDEFLCGYSNYFWLHFAKLWLSQKQMLSTFFKVFNMRAFTDTWLH